MIKSDFEKFAASRGISPISLDKYQKSNVIPQALINPYIVEERTGNPLQIDVFSKLFTNRILFLGTEIDSDVANIINSQLLYLQMDNERLPINLYLNTPGGSIIDGLSIYDTMRWIKPEVHTTCIGLAASMGSILLTAGEKGERSALPHSRILIHQPLGGTGYAQASDIEIVNNEIQAMKKELFTILAECSGNEYQKMVEMGDRDHWLTPEESLPGVYGKYGMIDEIIKKKQN